MRFPALRGALLVLAFLVPASALAYRPFDSTDASVAETGELEIELGPVGYIQTGALRQLVLPAMVLNYGFLPRWELVLEGAHRIALNAPEGGPRSSITDTGLYLKHVLRPGVLQGGTGLSVATEFGMLLPTYNDEVGVGGWAALILSDRLGPVTLHLNAAFEFLRPNGPGGVEALIVEGPEKWIIRPVAEVLSEQVRGGAYSISGLGGFIWRVSEEVAIDAGLRWGTSDLGQIREVRLGFTWSIPLAHKEEPPDSPSPLTK